MGVLQRPLKDWNTYLEKALIGILKDINKENGITLIAFTGDLIDQGGSSFDNIEEGFEKFKTEVIDRILKNLNLKLNQFIVTPGNHDILRNSDSEIIEVGLREHLKLDYENVSKFMSDVLERGNLEGIKRIIGYSNFEKNLYKNIEN